MLTSFNRFCGIAKLKSVALTPLIFTVKSDNTGTSNDNQFTIPAVNAGGGTYSYTTDDTVSGSGLSGATTITFPSEAGTYVVSITSDDNVPFKPFFFNGGGDRSKMTIISQWGTSVKWDDFENAFHSCGSMQVSATDAPDLTNSTSCKNGFYGCTTLNNYPMTVAAWMFAANTSLWEMFRYTSYAVDFDLQGLDQWDYTKFSTLHGFFLTAKLVTANYDAMLLKIYADGITGITINMGTSTFTDAGAVQTAHIWVAANNTLADGGAA